METVVVDGVEPSDLNPALRVLTGELGATERTLDRYDLDLAEGEAVRFAPGEFHQAYNPTDDPAVVLAIGAPAYSSEVESVGECTECGGVFHHRRPSVLGSEDGDGRIPPAECLRCGGGTRRTGRPD